MDTEIVVGCFHSDVLFSLAVTCLYNYFTVSLVSAFQGFDILAGKEKIYVEIHFRHVQKRLVLLFCDMKSQTMYSAIQTIIWRLYTHWRCRGGDVVTTMTSSIDRMW